VSTVAQPEIKPRVIVYPPRGVSSAAQTLLNQQQARIWEIRTPDVNSTARLTESLNEIVRLLELEDDWNLEGARRIDLGATRLVSRLVRSIELAVRQGGTHWQAPEVAPVPDGSVALTWDGDNRQILMVCRPGETSTVECIFRERGRRPFRAYPSRLSDRHDLRSEVALVRPTGISS
jgi:hypothetical protein